MVTHEITALGFHLKQNLWLGDYDFVVLEDDIATDVNIAMAARRDGIVGQKTPPGILTHIKGTPLGDILSQIERRSEVGAVEAGLELLKLSGKSANDLNLLIKKVATDAKDGKAHNVTVASLGEGGITIHCNSWPDEVAVPELERHCELKKYSQKAQKWFGLAIKPQSAELRFGVTLDYPWTQDSRMDQAASRLKPGLSMATMRPFLKSRATVKRKPGRNQPCHCGSGIKYKKCCLPKDEAEAAS